MAISDAIQEIAAAAFDRPYQFENIWRNYVRDRSSEFPGYGNTLVIATDTGAKGAGDTGLTEPNYEPTDDSATVTPGAAATAIKRPAPTLVSTTTKNLVVNKYYREDKIVDLLTERRLRPSMLNSAMENTGREMMEAINKSIRDAILADTDIEDVTTITVSVANLKAGTDATYLNALKASFNQVALTASGSKRWPPDRRTAIMNSRLYNHLVDKLAEDNLFLLTENPQFAVEGQVYRWRGFNCVEDISPGIGAETSDADVNTLIFLRPGEGVSFSGELARLRMVDSEEYSGWRIQADYSWGVAVTEPDKILRVKLNITA